MAGWRIRSKGDELANSESSDAKIKSAAATLTGQKLEAITLNTVVVPGSVRFGACFCFENDLRLTVHMYERTRHETLFMLYTPRTLICYDYDGVLRSKKLKYRRA